MNCEKYICQILERIFDYKYEEISLDKFLEDAYGLYKIIEDYSSVDFKNSFNEHWDALEEIFAGGLEKDFQNQIQTDIIPDFVFTLKNFI